MKKTIHICQSIEGALANWKESDWNHVASINGITADECKEWFRLQDFKGVKVIPIGEECEGFSYQTGCQGHEIMGEK